MFNCPSSIKPRIVSASYRCVPPYLKPNLRTLSGLNQPGVKPPSEDRAQGQFRAIPITMTTSRPRRDLPVEESRSELKRHFGGFEGGSANGAGWADLWDKGDFLPWDRNMPSPALPDTLLNHSKLIGNANYTINDELRRKRALVPACGRGYDVLLLESFGYDVIGLECSATAVREAKAWAESHADDYNVKDEALGKGTRRYICGDFFKDDWLEEAGLGKSGKFELIYDYTVPLPHLLIDEVFAYQKLKFFCALEPNARASWAKRMTELLASHAQANLICLEFPTMKPPSKGGPPFASPPKAYMEHLSHPGEEIDYEQEGSVRMNPLRPSSTGGLERVGHWHPADTHNIGKSENGEVEDWISVWRHR